MNQKKPNILVITCHDLGDYLGCYGTLVDTPHIDKLAHEGVLFEQHFAVATICSPSRGSLWTGCYPHTHGLMGLVPRGWEMNVNNCPHAAGLLATQGYETHLFGLQHEHWNPHALGFQNVHDVRSDFCVDVTPVFLDWLQQRHKSEKPFFAAVGYFEAHRIGSASQGPAKEFLGQLPSHFKRDEYQPADPRKVEVRSYLPDIPEVREELADFYGSINYLDSHVGKIMSSLADLDLLKDTLVIFTSDHGASFLHSKATMFDGGLKIPLIMRLPDEIPAGMRISDLMSNIDVLPTVLEIAGLPVPEHVQGTSFASRINGASTSPRENVFAEKNYTNYFDPSRMVRNKNYKYIRNGLRKGFFDYVLPEIEMSQGSFRNNLDVFKFYDSRRVHEELYDLENDPAEMHNLINEPAYTEKLVEMRTLLDDHLATTNDPFRRLQIDILMPEDVYPDVKGTRQSYME